jgi:Rps23 Pro-64 3,4-dihydroxylase Tpa1-like proline 4-hydroxylase
MELRLNPALDPRSIAKAYARDRFVQIPNIFEAEVANALEAIVASLPWRVVCQDDSERDIVLTQEQFTAMSTEERARLNAGVRERAARNIGFVHHVYPMISARLENWDPGHPIHALTDFLNSPPFFEFARTLISCPGLTKTDALATRYGPGHFLTRHVDDGERKERRAAYTLGFTRKWEPDWGGLLAFIDDDFNISRAFLPRFNALTVFDGLKIHSVTAVSPFTPLPRYSVVGWFRDDPPQS